MKHKKSYTLPAFRSPSSLPWQSSTSEFYELLAKSNFSFLQGASHPQELVERARDLGYSGLAICDSNGFYGIVRGFQAAFHPSNFESTHLTRTPNDRFRYLFGVELTPVDSSPITLLPMNKGGYVRLSRLLTTSKRRADKAHISVKLEEILEDASEDVIAFPLPPWNKETLQKIQDAFKDRVYLPVCKDLTWSAIQHYQEALAIEREFGIPIFATQKPLFHNPSRKKLHDVLTCVLHKTTLKEANTVLLANGERYLRPLHELAILWKERPDALHRTAEIAARLQFNLTELRYHYPREWLPKDKTASEYLRELTLQGMSWRYGDNPPAKAYQVLNEELSLIQELEYEDYFLTLWDICSWAKEKNILFQGRGSAANSIVCYTLGLTNIDPVGLKLLFGRFISRERGEPPDIDIDFEHERREEVIQEIYRRYGSKRAAMVCNVICYRSRLAVREVSKVFGLELEQVNKLIRHMGREGISRLIDNPLSVQKLGLSPILFQQILELSIELQGFPRHLGIHSGGFVITQDNLIDIVPVEKATMQDRYVIQWNKEDIEVLKMMKIDFLSLGMLTALSKSLKMLKEHKGIDWNLAEIPHEDKSTYAMIQKADTVGVFQIESRAQMSLLPRLRPETYYDLVIEVAIVRPGPLQGGMVHPFIKRRRGIEKTYFLPEPLKPILGKTLGVPIFQEQIMQIAIDVAGFSPGEADELRRIMSSSWTKPTTMEGLRLRVINGMLAKGITAEFAETIFKTIQGFASYGFPESHAASFALITYASCYLKCHHPDVFTTALLNSQPMGFYSPRNLIADAQRHGVKFLALDVQFSEWDYVLTNNSDLVNPSESCTNRNKFLTSSIKTPANSNSYPPSPKTYPQNVPMVHSLKNVRVGFRSLHGFSELFAQRIVEARKSGGTFKNLKDFVERTKLPRAALIKLATSGALKCFGVEPRQALWTLQSLDLDQASLTYAQAPQLNTDNEQQELLLLPRENSWEAIQREYSSKGFSIDTHPLAILRKQLVAKYGDRKTASARLTRAHELSKLRHKTSVIMAGLLSLLQKPPTAKGVCFLSIEDETGLFQVIIKPELYERRRMVIFENPLMIVRGELQCIQGVYNVLAKDIEPLTAEQLLPPRELLQ